MKHKEKQRYFTITGKFLFYLARPDWLLSLPVLILPRYIYAWQLMLNLASPFWQQCVHFHPCTFLLSLTEWEGQAFHQPIRKTWQTRIRNADLSQCNVYSFKSPLKKIKHKGMLEEKQDAKFAFRKQFSERKGTLGYRKLAFSGKKVRIERQINKEVLTVELNITTGFSQLFESK